MRSRLTTVALAALLTLAGVACADDATEEPMDEMEESMDEESMDDESMDDEMEESMDGESMDPDPV